MNRDLFGQCNAAWPENANAITATNRFNNALARRLPSLTAIAGSVNGLGLGPASQ